MDLTQDMSICGHVQSYTHTYTRKVNPDGGRWARDVAQVRDLRLEQDQEQVLKSHGTPRSRQPRATAAANDPLRRFIKERN